MRTYRHPKDRAELFAPDGAFRGRRLKVLTRQRSGQLRYAASGIPQDAVPNIKSGFGSGLGGSLYRQ